MPIMGIVGIGCLVGISGVLGVCHLMERSGVPHLLIGTFLVLTSLLGAGMVLGLYTTVIA